MLKKLTAGPDEEPVDIVTFAEEVRNVHLDGCPAQVESQSSCRSNLVEQIYSGADNQTYDHGLQPFTRKKMDKVTMQQNMLLMFWQEKFDRHDDMFAEYLYNVEAHNEAGSTKSEYAAGRTRDGRKNTPEDLS